MAVIAATALTAAIPMASAIAWKPTYKKQILNEGLKIKQFKRKCKLGMVFEALWHPVVLKPRRYGVTKTLWRPVAPGVHLNALGDTSKTMKLGKALTASLTCGPRPHISSSSWMLFPKFTYRRTIEQIFLLNNMHKDNPADQSLMLQICISPMPSEI
jgi:hypothetical protein